MPLAYRQRGASEQGMEDQLKDYYAILGIAPSADLKEIKRRYRELARRYHPDVNPSPEAARKITEINEAYDVLSDPERRARYDTERLFQATRIQQTPSNRSHPTYRSPSPSQSKVDFNGFGRVVNTPNPSAYPHSTAQGQRSATQSASAANRAAKADRLFHEAKIAFFSRRYHEAERLCRQAIALNISLSSAHELLGDILARRGDRENAVAAYSYAVQFNPQNQQAQIKLENLTRPERRRQKQTSRVILANEPPFSFSQVLEGPERELILATISMAACVGLAAMVALIYLFPGPMLFQDISYTLILAIVVGGFLSGLLLSFYGRLHPFSRSAQIQLTRTRKVAIGALLAFLALFWIGLSFFAYLLASLWQWVRFRKRASRSLLTCYGVTLALALLFWIIYRPNNQLSPSWHVLLFAGNFLLPTLLAGWKVGDRLRLPSSHPNPLP